VTVARGYCCAVRRLQQQGACPMRPRRINSMLALESPRNIPVTNCVENAVCVRYRAARHVHIKIIV
jgi:hypothetical protein